MKEFDVTITETLKLTVSVEASSKEEAQQMVSDQWHAGDHILDADNFVEVEFESNDGKEISAERAQDDTLEVLMVEPGQYPRVERIGSDLASLQKAVDGYIEAIYPYDDPVALICGEEAKLEGKPLNRALRDEDGDIYDIVAGKFFLCGLTAGSHYWADIFKRKTGGEIIPCNPLDNFPTAAGAELPPDFDTCSGRFIPAIGAAVAVLEDA